MSRRKQTDDDILVVSASSGKERPSELKPELKLAYLTADAAPQKRQQDSGE